MSSSGLATVLPLAALEVRAGAAVLVAVGERESVTSTAAPAPVGGATVQIGWRDGRISLCELTGAGAEGTYQASNVPGHDCNRPLEYLEGQDYLTDVETGTDLYTLSVTAPAPIDAARVELSPQLGVPSNVFGATLPSHPSNTALTVDWSADTGASERHAFVTVARVRYTGGTGATDALEPGNWQADPQPVWDDFPRTASEMIALVENDPTSSATVDASAFDQAGVYILVLTTTELSTEVSTNLFLGSSALAGAGTAFVFWVD